MSNARLFIPLIMLALAVGVFLVSRTGRSVSSIHTAPEASSPAAHDDATEVLLETPARFESRPEFNARTVVSEISQDQQGPIDEGGRKAAAMRSEPTALPPVLQLQFVEHGDRLYPLGMLASAFASTRQSLNATVLLGASIALRMDLAGTAQLPPPGHEPGSLEAANSFPPPAENQLSVSFSGRRYYFYPEEFPLYSNAVAREKEALGSSAIAWTQNEIEAVIAFAADSARLVAQ
jgi:hypothetical protein